MITIAVIRFISTLNLLNIVLLIDPFDCSKDPCHLAWIIRDNRQFLKFLKRDKNYDECNEDVNKNYRAMCSNGTSFDDLDQNGFDHCQLQNPGIEFNCKKTFKKYFKYST